MPSIGLHSTYSRDLKDVGALFLLKTQRCSAYAPLFGRLFIFYAAIAVHFVHPEVKRVAALASTEQQRLSFIPSNLRESHANFSLSYCYGSGIVNVEGALRGIGAPWGCQRGD